MKRRFEELIASRKNAVRMQITPPIYDDVYYEALKTMDIDDNIPGYPGVNIPIFPESY